MSWIYDIAALLGLLMFGIGLGFATGWAWGLAGSGAALVAVSLISARVPK